MNITVDISMYPLDQNYIAPIKMFIRKLRDYPDLQLVTNQVSTQVTGDFECVTRALNDCMAEAMAQNGRVVFIARYLNTGLDIARLPVID